MTTGALSIRRVGRFRPSPALALAATFATTYALFAPQTGDLAAQSFRSRVVTTAGLSVWNNYWFGGHHLLGYSVLFPLLGALVTPVVAGAVAMFVAVVLFVQITHPNSWRLQLATLWFTVGMTANLVSGRLTFVLGVAVGLAAIEALTRRWVVATALLGAGAALASPIAAAFLVLAGAVVVVLKRNDVRLRRAGAAMAIAPAFVVVAMARLFPEGGNFPFPWWAFTQVLVLTILCAAVVPRDARHVRVCLAVYGVACIATFAIPSPMGANVVRLGTVFAGPVLIAASTRERRYAVAALAVILLVWQWEAPIYDVLQLRDDPSVHEAYYRPVMRFLNEQGPDPFRIEIPVTANHWEASYVASRFPLARGWERQLDRKYNGLFYEASLTAAHYREWLHQNGVRFVVVPNLPLHDFDSSSQREVELVRSDVPYLQEVWHSRDWRVLTVRDSSGLVRGPARVTALSVDTFRIQADEPAKVLVRVRWSPNFHLSSGDACIGASRSGWTTLTVQHAGAIGIDAGVDLDDALDFDAERC